MTGDGTGLTIVGLGGSLAASLTLPTLAPWFLHPPR
jgi:hypothetical protein